MYPENSPATVQKALHWLYRQDENWPKHIKDSNTAVKMYLKSQKTEKPSSQFQKKLSAVCEADFAVQIKNNTVKESSKTFQKLSKNFNNTLSAGTPESPPQKDLAQKDPTQKDLRSPGVPADKLPFFSEKEDPCQEGQQEGQDVRLDPRSLQTIEDIKKEWNLKNFEESLRLLIQAGKKSLNRL